MSESRAPGTPPPPGGDDDPKKLPSKDEQDLLDALANPDGRSNHEEYRALAEATRSGLLPPGLRRMANEYQRVLEERNSLQAQLDAQKVKRDDEERDYTKKQRDQLEKERVAERTAFSSITDTRRCWGYALKCVAILGVVAAVLISFSDLRALAEQAAQGEFNQGGLGRERLWLFVGGHALITVAAIYFFYQLLRAGERLALPYWWVERNPDARMMLGVQDPASTIRKAAEEIGETTAKTLAPLVDAVVKAATTVKKS